MTRPHVIAIINCTPDSFYDGGRYVRVDTIRARADQCIREGADILELGGESTGPGSSNVAEAEERNRVLASLLAIKKDHPQITLAVDTWKSSIAHDAIAAGATIINDVTAGRGDLRMMDTIALSACRYVMMYSKDPTARTTKHHRQYDDVVRHIHDFLRERRAHAQARGIDPRQMIIDPGLGHFVSSDPRYSFEILKRLGEFSDLGLPVLVSPSRKSFLAGTQGVPPSQRLQATLDASGLAARNGASYIRTHDVAETVQLFRSMEAE